ncbi:MAG: hypothetical protein JNK32_07240 [Anaerolineales bacterium]|nr:hypothetical protein [Anaerolineales bacterium]
MNKVKLAFEALILLMHLFVGVFFGYINSRGEAQVVTMPSIILYALTMFILWGIARLKGKYIFFEVESVLHGTLIGVIITIPVIVINLIEHDIPDNFITTYLLSGIGIGLVIGAIYGKFSEIRAKSKLDNKQ